MPDLRLPDDPSINDDDLLYVRIFPSEDALVQAEGGIFRPASGSLRRGDEPLSVDLGTMCSPQETRDRDGSAAFHVAQFTARVVRQAGCRVARRPEDGNPAHAEVYGNRQDTMKMFTGGLTKGETKAIARQAAIILKSD